MHPASRNGRAADRHIGYMTRSQGAYTVHRHSHWEVKAEGPRVGPEGCGGEWRSCAAGCRGLRKRSGLEGIQ